MDDSAANLATKETDERPLAFVGFVGKADILKGERAAAAKRYNASLHVEVQAGVLPRKGDNRDIAGRWESMRAPQAGQHETSKPGALMHASGFHLRFPASSATQSPRGKHTEYAGNRN